MTTGFVHTFDPARGTGSVRCLSGTRVPFSARGAGFGPGDAVTFRLIGGLAGLYALHVELVVAPAPARVPRPVRTARPAFRASLGPAALAG